MRGTQPRQQSASRSIPASVQGPEGEENFDLDVSGSEDDPADGLAVASSNSQAAQPALPVPGPGATIEDYKKALSFYQVEYARMRTELRDVKVELATLQAQNQGRGKRTRVSKTKGIGELDERLAVAARQYALLASPWLNPSAFDFQQCPNIDPNSKDRYDNDESRQQGSAAELFSWVPFDLHPRIENADAGFIQLFKTAMQGARSNAINNVLHCANEIFGMPALHFARKGSYNRGEDADMQRLIRTPDKPKDYDAIVPVLFPAEDREPLEKQMPRIFQSMYLVQAAKVMLFGKQSLTRAGGTQSGKQPVGKQWHITHPTDGLIAFSAIVARYLLSPDTALEERGDETKIQYFDSFNLYKELLARMDAKRKESLVAFYLLHVFSIKVSLSSESQSATTPGIPQANTLSRLLLAINEDSVCEVDDDDNVDVDSTDWADDNPAALNNDLLTYTSVLSYAEPPQPALSASRSTSVAAATRGTTPSLTVALGAMSIARELTPGPSDEPAIANAAAVLPAPVSDSGPGASGPPPAAKKKVAPRKKGKERAVPPPDVNVVPPPGTSTPPSDVVAPAAPAARVTRSRAVLPKSKS
ncbi:hypothetical protein EVJ58_g2242 [Rhodofomes roseus]|uniref:Uncharacterized protein n=1 Tax=Rhodofomes roseus TaxID=34475 RepID=A0A4Y9YRK5_9APHY|nr:hypothetical protein EVJ58_g2242 [Rhodofomes roseus]